MTKKHWHAGWLVSVMFSILVGGASAEEVVRITAGEWPPYLGSDLPQSFAFFLWDFFEIFSDRDLRSAFLF